MHAYGTMDRSKRTSVTYYSAQQKTEGILQKMGEKGIVKSWKTRWFSLDQNILAYYKEKNDPVPISFILVQTVGIHITWNVLIPRRMQAYETRSDIYVEFSLYITLLCAYLGEAGKKHPSILRTSRV